MDYKYNIRGWLTEINDVSDLGGDNDAFGLKLLYNEEISGLNNNGLFNGNISSGIWCDAMDQSLQNAYTYTYDDLNRLRESKLYINSTGSWTDSWNLYSEYSYDKNGNLTWLTRFDESGNYMDDLEYSYLDNGASNQINYVDDSCGNPTGLYLK